MLYQAVFYGLAAVTVGSAALVAFSRNIVHSAFALLGMLMGAVGFYILLAADFVAMVQLLVYVGGILVLTLFAVMLTQGIADVTISNRAVAPAPARLTTALVGAVMLYALLHTRWQQAAGPVAVPTTHGIGDALLGRYVLPFELASVALLAALVGAVAIVRPESRRAGDEQR